MGWGNIYKRRMKVCTVAFLIYLDYKALQQREKWTNKTTTDALWENAHKRNAKRVLSLIVELEGLWVKLGQYLSTRADVLPYAFSSNYRTLFLLVLWKRFVFIDFESYNINIQLSSTTSFAN
ncbi:hypothetical protein ACFX2K_017133 [Malus domestica]